MQRVTHCSAYLPTCQPLQPIEALQREMDCKASYQACQHTLVWYRYCKGACIAMERQRLWPTYHMGRICAPSTRRDDGQKRQGGPTSPPASPLPAYQEPTKSLLRGSLPCISSCARQQARIAGAHYAGECASGRASRGALGGIGPGPWGGAPLHNRTTFGSSLCERPLTHPPAVTSTRCLPGWICGFCATRPGRPLNGLRRRWRASGYPCLSPALIGPWRARQAPSRPPPVEPAGRPGGPGSAGTSPGTWPASGGPAPAEPSQTEG